jgi:AmmeMemoRadiSam system protein B
VTELDQALRECFDHGLTMLHHDTEHSLEIELPFLQHVLGQFRLLPVWDAHRKPLFIRS